MTTPTSRAYLALAAAYYPALSLVLAGASWSVGKPVDGRTVLTFLGVSAVAGLAVAILLRRQILNARGAAKVVLVGILALVLLTPLVVLPDLLLGLSGLHPDLDAGQKLIALLVVTLGASLNPVFWAFSAGYVLLLRQAATGAAPAPPAAPLG